MAIRFDLRVRFMQTMTVKPSSIAKSETSTCMTPLVLQQQCGKGQALLGVERIGTTCLELIENACTRKSSVSPVGGRQKRTSDTIWTSTNCASSDL